jgi:hypothetical protein
MDCIKCGFELVNGQDICPRCGASQSETEDNSQGISMELPVMEASDSSGDEKKQTAKKKKATTSRKTKKAVVPEEKIEEDLQEPTEDISDEEPKKEGGKNWLYVVIGIAAVVVLLVIGYFVVVYEPGGADEAKSVILAATEDEIFLVEGAKMTEIAEMPEDLYAEEIITAIDANSFYVIADAEYDDDAGEYTGDLLYIKSNGKETDIDSDVVVDTQVIVGNILWYEKADGEDRIVCCYDGRKVTEVIEEDTLSDWYGTDKAGKAFYTLMDEDDYETEVFVIENGDEESIMDDAQIGTLSSDYKKALLVVQDDDESVVYIYDGKDDFEVMEDAQNILLNVDTFDMILVADADDMVLYYIPYGRDAIEIDDEVNEILTLPNLYSSYFTDDLGDMIYYGKDGDLFAADFRGKDNDKILKDYEELGIISQPTGSKEMVYVDDDEVVRLNITTLKETSVELPDADDLTAYDVVILGKWYVYRTEENKELFAYDGSNREPVELSDDADEISYFISFMDKYVLWLNYDNELIISQMKEKTDEEIGDDVYEFWPTDDGEIYFLSDYEDGEGDLYYMSRVGRDAKKLEKNITDIFRLYYE